MDYLIGVDVGTTSTKAVLYDQQANVLQDFKQGYSLYRDASGMAEQNPDTLVEAVQSVIKQAAQAANLDQGKLLAVSFSSANQSLILLDDKHQPLTRALTWADTRARAV
ncbi:gluconate kinase, partial [Limosilactobacillus fermentum]|nr:gluconate kinase [Limosilactobacillus fermentum]